MKAKRMSNPARRRAAFALACGSAAALIAGSTTPASAAPLEPAKPSTIGPRTGGDSECLDGTVCYYDNNDYTGLLLQTIGCGFWNVGNMGYGDRISSIDNFTNSHVYVYNYSHGWVQLDDVWPNNGYFFQGAKNNSIDGISVCFPL